MALRKLLILRKPRSGCLEGRRALIQPIDNSFTGSQHEGEASKSLPSRRRGTHCPADPDFLTAFCAGVTKKRYEFQNRKPDINAKSHY